MDGSSGDTALLTRPIDFHGSVRVASVWVLVVLGAYGDQRYPDVKGRGRCGGSAQRWRFGSLRQETAPPVEGFNRAAPLGTLGRHPTRQQTTPAAEHDWWHASSLVFPGATARRSTVPMRSRTHALYNSLSAGFANRGASRGVQPNVGHHVHAFDCDGRPLLRLHARLPERLKLLVDVQQGHDPEAALVARRAEGRRPTHADCR